MTIRESKTALQVHVRRRQWTRRQAATRIDELRKVRGGRRIGSSCVRHVDGLTASIWTRDLDRAYRLASRIEAGFMWINDASVHYMGVPFGGYKQSGIGEEECFEEMLACTQMKNVNVRIRRAPFRLRTLTV